MKPLDPEARALLLRLPALVAQHGPLELCSVLSVLGSAPRAPGARMVSRRGRLVAGTIGGGHLELRALATAASLRGDGDAFADRSERVALGPELAQCCGGVVVLGWQAIDAAAADALAAAVAAGRGALSTLVDGHRLDEDVGPGRAVVVFGAGHVARALAQALAPLPWRVLVCDGRAEFADPAAFPPSTEVVAAPPAELLAAWGWPLAQQGRATAMDTLPPPPPPARTAALVMTHDHALDRAITAALLATGRVGGDGLDFVGLIGSRSKIASARRELEAQLGPEAVAALVAPIGLRVGDRLLGGKLPGEIAIAVAAQLVLRWQDAP